jgi:hypothetical protein
MPLGTTNQSAAAAQTTDRSTSAIINRWVPPVITLCLFGGILHSAVIEPLTRGVPWMTYEEDDFFYYLKIAQNLAHGAGSTFNGIVPTNGYHPLWLLLLTVFSFITTKPKAILLFLTLCSLTATMATYFFSRILIRATQVGAAMASALAAYVAVYALHLYTGGMEVILTIPLALAFLVVAQRSDFWQRRLWQSACLGLLVSAMALSRLDSIMLASLIFLCLLLNPAARRMIGTTQIKGLALGLLPLVLYFLSNQIWFHTWLPVSGLAKQLKTNHLPSDPAFRSLYTKQPSQLLTIVPVILAIALLPTLYKRLTTMQQVLYPIVLIFPFFYLCVLSCLSDWKIWDWYFYSFRIALCVALAMLCLWSPTARVLRIPALGAAAALVMIAMIVRTHSATGAQFQLLEVADDVRNFAASHPGTYAMGDRSGMVAYLLPDPMVQTEGLVMDRPFLENIRQQTPLRSTLQHYNVRYYIATTYPPYADGCFHATEPWQAGPASPHMTAKFCEQPVAVFQQRDVRTMIYDLQSSPVPNR